MKFFLILLLFTFTPNLAYKGNNERIFDGSEAPIDAFPWMVSIRLNFLNIITRDCGGVIISDIFLLTAASCFQDMTLFTQYFIIKAGIHTIERTEQVRSISHLILHPNYMNTLFLNDLALVRVSAPFDLNSPNVSTISFSNLTFIENMDLITIGWSVFNQTNPPIRATSLQQVIVQENIECARNKSIDSMTQLCTTGTCLGDTGGPLMIYSNDNQQYELVGITSFRNVCTTEGIFTRIAPFIDWILEIVNNPLPTLPTVSSLPPTRPTTTPPEILGPPISFVCNTSYSCGCSPIPVVFHDKPPISSARHSSQERIVGGETAQPYSWFWVVSIRSPFVGHRCGGSLINNEWILTAAHCLPSISNTIHIGVHDETLPSPQIHTVIKVIIHPGYIPAPKFINDIALIRLSSPVNLSTSKTCAGLSCLPPKNADLNYPNAGTQLTVIGWGTLASGGSRPTKLRQVRVKTLADDDWRCASSSFDHDRQFCAMVDGGGKDSCQGDSGGPIHQWLNDHWEQVGIVSYGTGCALANHPGVYTRLSFYYDWIQSNIKEINQTTLTTSNIVDTTTPVPNTTIVDSTTPVTNAAIVCKTKLFFILFNYMALWYFLFH